MRRGRQANQRHPQDQGVTDARRVRYCPNRLLSKGAVPGVSRDGGFAPASNVLRLSSVLRRRNESNPTRRESRSPGVAQPTSNERRPPYHLASEETAAGISRKHQARLSAATHWT